MSKAYLHTYYQEQVVPALKASRGYTNIHEVPRLEKIVINSGFNASIEKAGIEEAVKEIGLIAGQKPVVTIARKSVSNFKLREGMPIGTKVTLRGRTMYEFLYRLLAVALPGIRDFRGVPDKLDGQGNYSLGIADHTIFPEIHHDSNKRTLGMDVCIVTSANTDDEGRELLRLMGMPFRKRTTTATPTTAQA
jgi:large subunit ribosomal protein L5